jgi:hypothetical protein
MPSRDTEGIVREAESNKDGAQERSPVFCTDWA